MAACEHHPFADTALTLIGVHSLFEPEHLIARITVHAAWPRQD